MTQNEIPSDRTLSTHLRLAHRLGPKEAGTLEEALAEIEGLKEWTLDPARGRLRVRYDVTRTGLEAILGQLQVLGLAPKAGLGQRLRQGWTLFREQNARDNARAPAPACCNHPPRVHH